jgi:hypothetical protein
MTTLPQEAVTKLQGLSPEDLQKVLQFVESLSPPPSPVPERPGLCGLFAYRGIDISVAEIAAARREAWGNFPRDIPLD